MTDENYFFDRTAANLILFLFSFDPRFMMSLMKRLGFFGIVITFIALSLSSCAMSSCANRSEDFGIIESRSSGSKEVSAASAPLQTRNDSLKKLDSFETSDEILTEGSEESESSQAGDEERRMRVYNGSAGLIVEDTEESRRDLEVLARENNGYVESSYTDYVVLRIPAERFNEVFDFILTLGDVEYSRVETWDITEAYSDIAQHLNTAEETRRRLYTLLEKSTDPAERARILKEIGRLTEEIESLKQQMAMMEARVAFSRITVQITPRIQGSAQRYEIPFPWIAYLDPLSPAGSDLRAHLDIDLGGDFAVFDKENVFMAENSDGVQIFLSTVDNSPRGDSDFWQKALFHHMGPYYAKSIERTVAVGDSNFLGVEFLSKDRNPFKYYVGVYAEGRKIHILEIFSPDGTADFTSIYKAFAEGDLK